MKAYITLLSNENYLDGVLVLNKSLQMVDSKYPFYCLLSMGVDEKIKQRLRQEAIQYIQLTKTLNEDDVNSDGHFSHWNFTFDKLQIWGLTKFEKIVFLDSDMLVLRNIDSLFNREEFSAVCAGHSYPGNHHWSELNSGLLVIKPNQDTEKGIAELAKTVVLEYRANNQLIGDQDVINHFYPDWEDERSLHLDEGYNLFASHLTYYIRQLGYSFTDKGKPIYVIHFIGRTKPWMIKGVKSYLWLFYVLVRNPLYWEAYNMYRSLLRKCI